MIICSFPLSFVHVLCPLNMMLNIDMRVPFTILNSLGKFFCKNGCFLGGDKVVVAAANALDFDVSGDAEVRIRLSIGCDRTICADTEKFA